MASPSGVFEIGAPHPTEISGVAAVPGGYAVVGDEEPTHGCIWPGGARFRLGAGLQGPESIGVGFRPDGKALWMVLGENKRRLVDLDGGFATFGKTLKEVSGRGLEGLAVRWRNKSWQVAVSWEGGFYDPDSKRRGLWALPRVGVLRWRRGRKQKARLDRLFELDVPRPSRTERFRVPDLIWDGDGILALLASTDEQREARSHVWLQRFDLEGRQSGNPVKLEDLWGPYANGKNWEGLDRTLDGVGLVMAYDAQASQEHRVLVVFPTPD